MPKLPKNEKKPVIPTQPGDLMELRRSLTNLQRQKMRIKTLLSQRN